MPNGCFKGKHRTRDYTAEYWRISAISFKPIFKAELGQYVFISGILSKHHQRYKVIWVDDGLAVVEFCFDRKKLSVSLVLDNRSASNKLYIVCPHCKTRRQHLYAASNTYACRGCLKLHYLSQSER